jgi:hypothetical protein
MTANCSLEVDPNRAVISVGPRAHRAWLSLEEEMLDLEFRLSGGALDQMSQPVGTDDALVHGEPSAPVRASPAPSAPVAPLPFTRLLLVGPKRVLPVGH